MDAWDAWDDAVDAERAARAVADASEALRRRMRAESSTTTTTTTATTRRRARGRGAKIVLACACAIVVAVRARACEANFGWNGESDAATAADGETATANVVADAKREEVPVDVESVESVIKEKKRRKKSVKKAAKKPVEEEEFKPYDPELGEGESAIGSIHEAIDDDDMEELEDLLRWKPNLREKCQKLGETRHYVPIMKAAFLGNARAMDLLIDYGANVNEIDAIGYTVLMRSVLSKCAECVRILVEAGAVVNYVQKTPMMDLGLSAQKLAMLMGEREIAEILRNAGADELETGAEKKRRLQKEGAERFKEHVEAQGIDVDIDKLLNTTVDDLNVKNSQSGDVVVNVNGTNATMTHDETKDYRNLEEKIAQAKLKAEAEARAKEACASDAGDGSCAFDPTTKDEL